LRRGADRRPRRGSREARAEPPPGEVAHFAAPLTRAAFPPSQTPLGPADAASQRATC
jgi:hypothetical protein